MALTKVTYSMINGASVNVRDFGAVGDGVTDDTNALQAAFDYAETLRTQSPLSVGVMVVFGNGDTYKVTSTVTAKNVSIEGNGAKILADTDINILLVEGNVHVFRDFHCWFSTQRNNSNAIAIKLTDGTLQASKNTWIGVTTRFAYTGFYNVKTGSANADGSIFGTVFINCRADYNYDWGWYFNTGGGTTLSLIGCGVSGRLSTPLPDSKGYFFQNFGEIVMSNCSADQLMDGQAITTIDCSSIKIDTFAIESCEMITANRRMISFTTATHIQIGLVYAKVTTIDVGAGNNAYLVYLNNCLANDFGDIISTNETLTSGTLYKLRTSGSGKNKTDFVPLSEVDVAGVYQNFFDFSRFVGLTNVDPSGSFTDAHEVGDIALNRSVTQGREVGWVCTSAGTPGTWMPFGQASVMTSIGATPRYVGQFAVVAGVGYIATGTASTADWKQITP